jgi:hypothetical protein
MKKSYLNSERNSAVSLMPSMTIRLLLMVLFVCLFGNAVNAQTTVPFTTPGTSTWIVPCGVTSITVQAWGGGGAGGGSGSNTVKGGAGGAGGSYATSIIAVTPGDVINYSVGAGAKGVANAGAAGQASWIVGITTVFAQGGLGGAAPSGSTVTGPSGSILSSFGTTTSPGGSGANGTSTLGGAGGSGSNPAGGAGGSSKNSTGGPGNNGSAPGGGGGGAFVNNSTDRIGGNGGNGKIIITFTLPAALVSYSVTGGGSYCSGETGVSVGLSNSTTGVDYQLQVGGVATGTAVSGTGSAISFGLQTVAGTYTIMATNATTNCTLAMTGSVIIAVNPLPTAYTVTGGGSCCSSGTGVAVGLSNSTTGVNYQLQVGGVAKGTVVSGTGSAISFGLQIAAGTYTVMATNASTNCTLAMTGSVVITVNNSPLVVVTPDAAQTIANGASIVPIVISDSNNGSGTIFSWSRSVNNNIIGTIDASGSSLKGNLTNTSTIVQTVTFTVTATSGGCASSTTVTVTVLPSFNISFHQNSDRDVQTIPTYGSNSNSGSNSCTSVDGTGNDLDLYSGWYFIHPTNSNSDIIRIPGLTYKWQYKKVADATWTNMATTSVTDVAATVMYTPGTYLFRLMVTTDAGLFMDYSDILTLTVINNYTNLYNGGNFTNQTFCTGETPPLFIETTPIIGKLDYQWYSSTTQNGAYAAISGATSATYQVVAFTGAPKWFYRKTTYIDNGNNGCNLTSRSNSFSLTNNTASAPAAPAIIVVQPTCAARTTGTVTISNPVNGFKYAVTLEGDTANYLLNTTVFTAGPGKYNVTAKNTCSATPSIAVPITISMANTYNGTAWSNGTPTADQDIIFDAHYNINGTDIIDITACSCTVNPNVKVFISPTTTLTITNEVVVNGSLTFKTSTDRSVAKFPKSYSGSLVQKNDNAINIGVITYERNVPAIHPTDYIYWSSPVLNETLLDFVNSTHSPIDRLFSFDPVNDAWKNETANATNTMAQGIGYCIYGPANNSSSSTLDFNASFTGTPNNGVFTISGVGINQSLLIGNPYPSAINADLFIKANLNVIDGSLYFWTHNTDPDNGEYTYNDYATYNLTGGTGTVGAGQAASTGITVPANANPSYINANIPNGYIAAGQGFFVGSNASISNTISNPTIFFNNSMRIDGAVNGDNNSQFFKTKGNTKGKVTNAIEKDRVWLNLSNDQGVFKQTLVGYITGATNDYDTTFDADSYDSLDSADFYSVNGDSNLVIQGRALPFDENDEVPLGYRTTINGDFTINIDQVDGSLTNQAVFIEDKLTNTVTDLKSGNYTFNTVAGTFNERFVLKYTNKTLSVDEADKEDGILVLYSNNYKTLIIHNNVMDAAVNSVVLYNITGQKISNWDVKDSEQTTIQIPIKNISSGIYIVKVNTTTGESSKKIIVN